MAFGHASKPTKKYVYGCREFLPRPVRVGPLDRANSPPGQRILFDGHALAVEQMYKAHKYQNKLVELERARRAAVTARVEEIVPTVRTARELAEAKQVELAAARAVLRAENSDNRDRAPDGATQDIAAESRSLWAEASGTRRLAFTRPDVKAALAAIDEDFANRKATARTDAVSDGLYWATSLLVSQRVKRTGMEPRFKRFDGSETISVQFQRKPDKASEKVPVLDSNGNPRIHPRSGKPMTAHVGGGSLSTESLFVHNSLCWLEPREWHTPLELDGWSHYWCHFRVGSESNGSPKWAKIPLVLHRDFPEGEVKWAHLMRTRIGTHFRWEVAFDVARDEWTHHPAGRDRAQDGTVAVALGWRYIDGAVRAGYWVGSDGASGYFTIPDDLVSQWRRLESLQSIRDRNFDVWKEGVRKFLATRTDLTEEWLRRTETIANWNSPARLSSLVIWWRFNRLSGDALEFRDAEGELVRARTENWNSRYSRHKDAPGGDFYTGGRLQDKHLCDAQANLRDRLIRWRNDLYRRFAIDLSYQYRSVAVADINWDEIAYNPQPESGEEPVSKTNRAISACASLRDHLSTYMQPVTVDSAHVTDTCCRCHRRVRHPEAGRYIRCERCGGGNIDRAENAARNILFRTAESVVVE